MTVYACSDLHGRYDLWKMIDDFTDNTDRIYVLGDCGDRGPEGWRVIKEVYNSPKTIMLKGNHEDMLVKAMKDMAKCRDKDEENIYMSYSYDYRLCCSNGGKKTFNEWRKEKYKYSWIKKLDELPLEKIYINKRGQRIVMCHAGYTPHIETLLWTDDYLWDRDHFCSQWDMDYIDTFMIHGHTPIPYMDEYMWNVLPEKEVGPGVYWYSQDDKGVNHKCNIDCGAFFTGHTALLNLDTFEQHIFMAEDCTYED